VHEALVRAFRDIGDDAENHVVILTGTGNEFCAQITADGFDFFTPTGYDKILREGTKVLENILDIQVPMIAAINGPFTVHSEYALLCDIVIATEDAYFEDAPHPAFGIVPGDGLHIVWPEVIGEIRGRYFLLSGQKLSAAEAKAYGAVNEVVARDALLPRAWELARHMKKQNLAHVAIHANGAFESLSPQAPGRAVLRARARRHLRGAGRACECAKVIALRPSTRCIIISTTRVRTTPARRQR
jgi:enoyl-CoA hydratase/carnithine racemase